MKPSQQHVTKISPFYWKIQTPKVITTLLSSWKTVTSKLHSMNWIETTNELKFLVQTSQKFRHYWKDNPQNQDLYMNHVEFTLCISSFFIRNSNHLFNALPIHLLRWCCTVLYKYPPQQYIYCIYFIHTFSQYIQLVRRSSICRMYNGTHFQRDLSFFLHLFILFLLYVFFRRNSHVCHHHSFIHFSQTRTQFTCDK